MTKNGGSFWSGGVGRTLMVLGCLAALIVGGAVAILASITHPRRDRQMIDPADLMLHTEDVTFPAADNVMLSGWFVRGRSNLPVIVLCHDLGSSRMSMVNSAVALNRIGYPLLLLDFRGHGQSGGKGSTLGIDERLDVGGGIDYLKGRQDTVKDRFGAWGIGMGAYAAALAAGEREEIVALALDSVYPEVQSQLDRLVRAELPPALDFALPPLRLFYDPYFAFRLRKFSVAGSLDRLADRNILLFAPSSLPDRAAEQKALYAALPEGRGADKNLLEVKSSAVSGIYGEDKKTYDDALVAFFSKYLPPGSGPRRSQGKPIEIVEPR